MASFGFFALVLVLIYWVNRAVILFDQLIADGQSAGVFFQFTALSLPGVIAIVLPIASFAAAVYVTNRMSNESELTIVQATGFSSYRIARPVLYFGLIVASLMAVLVHVIEPLAETGLRKRQAEITENVTSRLLVEGTFVHPTNKVTFYIRDISPEGELLDLFLSDATDDDVETTYTARKAFLVKGDTGPQLVMIDGLIQTLNRETENLTTTKFNDFAFDIGGLLSTTASDRINYLELSTLALLRADEETQTKTKRNKAILVQAGHDRVIHPILAIVTALIGFSTLLIGGFSRFGVWRQVVIAIVLIMLLQLVESTAISEARKSHTMWPILYLPATLGFIASFVMLWRSNNPQFFAARKRVAS